MPCIWVCHNGQVKPLNLTCIARNGLDIAANNVQGTVDSLYKHTWDVSNKLVGPRALFSVQVSFIVSTIVNSMTFDHKHGKGILVPEAC